MNYFDINFIANYFIKVVAIHNWINSSCSLKSIVRTFWIKNGFDQEFVKTLLCFLKLFKLIIINFALNFL